MRHFDKNELAQAGRLVTWAPGRPRFSVRDGASMRLVAAMAEHCPHRRGAQPFSVGRARLDPFAEEPAEGDAQYFRRRSTEEDQAAAEANSPEARAAHLDLARRYARLSRRTTGPHRVGAARREHLFGLLSRRFVLPERTGDNATGPEPGAERKQRLDELLDEALLGSFPASDPVSIAHVR